MEQSTNNKKLRHDRHTIKRRAGNENALNMGVNIILRERLVDKKETNRSEICNH
ncbi:MAG: hypothetical protein WA144_07610 [Candidatus Methanoperedens sp.]